MVKRSRGKWRERRKSPSFFLRKRERRQRQKTRHILELSLDLSRVVSLCSPTTSLSTGAACFKVSLSTHKLDDERRVAPSQCSRCRRRLSRALAPPPVQCRQSRCSSSIAPSPPRPLGPAPRVVFRAHVTRSMVRHRLQVGNGVFRLCADREERKEAERSKSRRRRLMLAVCFFFFQWSASLELEFSSLSAVSSRLNPQEGLLRSLIAS